MTYIFNALFFALTGDVDFLTTDLVEDVFGVMGDDVLATFDGDLTAIDFGNDLAEAILAGVLDLIAAFFLLQPKSISRDNIMNLKTYTALSKTCCLCVSLASTQKVTERKTKLPCFFYRTWCRWSSAIKCITVR
jgi:hypothetical protein